VKSPVQDEQACPCQTATRNALPTNTNNTLPTTYTGSCLTDNTLTTKPSKPSTQPTYETALQHGQPPTIHAMHETRMRKGCC